MNQIALAFTAKHVVEYIRRLDGYDLCNEERMFEQFGKNPGRILSLKHVRVIALRWNDGKYSYCDVVSFSYFRERGSDVAIARLKISDDSGGKFTEILSIDSLGPSVGDEVIAVGYCFGEFQVNSLYGDGHAEHAEVGTKLKLSYAKVTDVLEKHRLIRSPCFLMESYDVGKSEIDPGMSGGPVLYQHAENDGYLVSCGIVSSSCSFENVAVCSILHPIYNLKFGGKIPTLDINEPTLRNFQSIGGIKDVRG